MKRKRGGTSSTRSREADWNGADKPDYAADLFRPPVRHPEAKKDADDSRATVRDRLDGGALAKLETWKAELERSAAANKPAPQTTQRDRSERSTGAAARNASARSESQANPLSFAELFDPQDKTEESFADLLDKSKLDWHKFKE